MSDRNSALDLLLFSFCVNNERKNFDIEKLINYVQNYKIPKFPISGKYLKEHGYKSGESLGKKLKELEEEWIKNNFLFDEKILKKSLDKRENN